MASDEDCGREGGLWGRDRVAKRKKVLEGSPSLETEFPGGHLGFTGLLPDHVLSTTCVCVSTYFFTHAHPERDESPVQGRFYTRLA